MKRGEDIKKLTLLKRRRFLAFPPLHRFWKRVRFIILILGSVGVIAALSYFIFLSSSVHINKIVYKHGEQEASSPVFANEITGLLGKNMIFAPLTPLTIKILEKYPDEIQSVRFRRTFPGTLTVSFEKFPETANAVIRLPDIQKKFILNEKGLVVQQDAENPELPYITFDTEKLLEIKTRALPEDFLTSMVKAEKLFTDKFGMKVNEVQYKRREREAHLVTARNFIIMLDLTQDVEIQLFKLKRALPAVNIFEDPLAYIDLRISGQSGDKVIIKRK